MFWQTYLAAVIVIGLVVSDAKKTILVFIESPFKTNSKIMSASSEIFWSLGYMSTTVLTTLHLSKMTIYCTTLKSLPQSGRSKSLKIRGWKISGDLEDWYDMQSVFCCGLILGTGLMVLHTQFMTAWRGQSSRHGMTDIGTFLRRPIRIPRLCC